MTESFSIKDLAKTIALMLNLSAGDTVELKKNREDANQILVIRHGHEEKST